MDEVKKFSNVWNYNGVVIPLTDVHMVFALNFANVVLKSFFLQAEANMSKVIEAQVQLRLTEERTKRSSIIVSE
jgi:hypothetical protein